MFCLFFGDLRQFPPFRDIPIYPTSCPPDEDRSYERRVIDSFQVKLFLNICRRQGPSEQLFREALDNIATGTPRVCDWELLRNRRESIGNPSLEIIRSITHLSPTNIHVVAHNERILGEMHDTPIAPIKAEHNNAMARPSCDPYAQGLPRILKLAVGCRVMLSTNLCVSKGLFNGSLGYVRMFIGSFKERG